MHPTDWNGNVLEDVWVAKDATVFKTAYLHGPCIIGHRTESVRCAFIRAPARWWATTAWWALPR